MKASVGSFKYKLTSALVAAEVLSTFETAMIFAALRFMIEDFGSPGAVGWTITSFMLVASVSAALFSRLGDMYDRRKMLLLVIGFSVIGSVIAGASSTLAGVIVGRIIQGGAGAVFPLCVGILREQVEAKSLPIYLGILTAILSVSGGLGLFLGGVLVDNFAWQSIFYANAAVGIIAWVSVYYLVPPGKSSNAVPGTNFIGGLLFVPGLVCCLLAVNKSMAWGWMSLQTLSLLAVGVTFLVSWVRSELRAKEPLLNIRLLLNREILLVNLSAAILGLTWNQFTQFWSIFLQQPTATGAGLGLSASVSGLVLQPQTLMAFIGGPVAGWFYLRYGTRSSMVVGALVLGLAWIAAMFKHDTIPFIIVLMVFMGLSSAFLYAMLPIILAREAPIERTSEAAGMMTVVRATATGIGAQIVAFLLSSSTVPAADGVGNFPDNFAYGLTMTYIAAGSALVAVMYLCLSKAGNTGLRPVSVSDKSV